MFTKKVIFIFIMLQCYILKLKDRNMMLSHILTKNYRPQNGDRVIDIGCESTLYEREVELGQEDRPCAICAEVKHFKDFSKRERGVCKPCVKWVGLSPRKLREEYFRILKRYPSIYSTTFDISKDGHWEILAIHKHLFITFGASTQKQIDFKKNKGTHRYYFEVFHSPTKAIEATIRDIYSIMRLVSAELSHRRLIGSLKSLDFFIEEVSRIEFTMKDLDRILDWFVIYIGDTYYTGDPFRYRDLTDEEKTSVRNKLEKYAKD